MHFQLLPTSYSLGVYILVDLAIRVALHLSKGITRRVYDILSLPLSFNSLHMFVCLSLWLTCLFLFFALIVSSQ